MRTFLMGSILLLYLLCGLLIGLGAPPLGMLADWFLFGTLGAMATCAVQLLLSLVIRSFPIPVGIALLGGIAGMLLTARGYGLLWDLHHENKGQFENIYQSRKPSTAA